MKTKTNHNQASLFANLSEKDFQVTPQPATATTHRELKTQVKKNKKCLHLSNNTWRKLNSWSNALGVAYLTAFVVYFLYKCL